MNITDIQGKWKLNNGVEMPYFGLGVFQSNTVKRAIHWALDAGYRHIDTASIYGNEVEVGEAVKESGLSRSDLFIVSKVWNTEQGYDETLAAFDRSLDRLQMDYLDLYLVHWPVKGKFVETWKALEKIYERGLVRAIGVSNFLMHHLEILLPECNIIPTVNQMEFHPYLVQQDLIDYCRSRDIHYEAWSPIMRGKIFEIEMILEMARKYSKTPAQIVLRWDLQKGVMTIPKSEKKERIIENSDLFDFELSEKDVALLDGLDKNERMGPDPDVFY